MNLEGFQIAGGSVAGRTHVLSGRNNQDAFAWKAEGPRLVAVVTDGCSTGSFTEVGARLGAELFAARAMARLAAHPDDPEVGLCGAADDVTNELTRLATALGGPLPARVESTLLFTVVGVAIQPDCGWFFSIGDGVTARNGDLRLLGPFPGNAPPYLAYRLLGASIPLRVERFDLAGMRSVAIGTDGACDLPDLQRLCSDDRVFSNRDMLRRRLTVLSKTAGALLDDTTVVAIRREGKA